MCNEKIHWHVVVNNDVVFVKQCVSGVQIICGINHRRNPRKIVRPFACKIFACMVTSVASECIRR